jgi:hypothetical protein
LERKSFESIDMKTLRLCLYLIAASFLAPSLFAQGPLTPPGVPAPTMKSLDQIDAKLEARTPITSAPFAINASGSYYLTKNLNVTTGDAVTISASQVTLDLNGFTISSTNPTAAGSGIRLVGADDVTIMNGHIKGGVTVSSVTYSGPGFAHGISFSNQSTIPNNIRVTGVSVSGCQNNGISVGGNSIVEHCTVNTVGSVGIAGGHISHSNVRNAGSTAISGDVVSDCYGQGLVGGVFASSIASSCYGDGGVLTGISAPTVLNSEGHCNGINNGVTATNAQNSAGYSESGAGLEATTATNCFGKTKTGSYGLHAGIVATGCFGLNNGSGYGLRAEEIANSCFGIAGTGGTGLWATVGNTCNGRCGTGGTPTSIAYKYNSP